METLPQCLYKQHQKSNVTAVISSTKMSHTTLIKASLLIISLTVYTVKSDSHVIVRPTDSDPSICGGHATCDTLSNFLSKYSTALTEGSSIEVEFLEGAHNVVVSDTAIKIEGKRNVTWHGNDAVEITCETALALVFVEVEFLEIKHLNFYKCGDEVHSNNSKLSNVSATLFFDNIQTLQMKKVNIRYSKGYGMLALNLARNTQIHNCKFLDNNNKECSKESSRDRCVGGNIALYFFSRARALKEPVAVYINNCTIERGSDQSGTTTSCTNRQDTPSSPSAFRANGLAVILAQENYTVNFRVCNTNFSDNIGDKMYPAVLIHDYGTTTNNVEFYQNNFLYEGVLLISIQKSMGISKSAKIIAIKNCLFCHNVTMSYFPDNYDPAGIHVCIKQPKVSNSHLQTIEIVESNFSTELFTYLHARESKTAVVKISYLLTASNHRPSILTVIKHCNFTRIIIPSVALYLHHDDSLLDHQKPSYSSSNIIVAMKIQHTTFLKNSGKPFTVLIEGPQKGDVLSKSTSSDVANAEFTNCTFRNGRTLKAQNTNIVLRDCLFLNSIKTAVHAEYSVVTLHGYNTFKENEGVYGGALNLNRSKLLLMPNSQTYISRNRASYGGGIFAIPIEQNFSEVDVGTRNFCTITKSTDTDSAAINIKNNQAHYAGYSIFGGKYVNCTYNCTGKGQCKVIPDTVTLDSQYLPPYINITPYSDNNTYIEVSSPVNRICLCEDNNRPTDKCGKIYNVKVFPGQEFTVSLIALGEFDGSTSVMVTAESLLVPDINKVQILSINCTTIKYSVRRWGKHQIHTHITLSISKDTPREVMSECTEQFIIHAYFSECPRGWNYSQNSFKCECNNITQKFDMNCDRTNGTICIQDKQWIGYFNHELAVANKYPLDYCTQNETCVNLSRPDEQCNFNRSGTLCGACHEKLSMVLGTSNCKKCSNIYLLLIIPFALAGVALVVLLFKSNLTVSVGHVNGIIFYANIVQINKSLLFPSQNTAYKIFTPFIAWLNLDLGIEMCFFENMDTYAKVWLQFVFPVYLWILIGLTIVLAKYFPKLSSLIGENSVPVLATLFLLSYFKLLRIISKAVTFTYIEFEEKPYKTVWLMDGSIEYFGSKHAPLFVVASIFLFAYILPLTLLVLLAPCLQAKSHYKAFKWVNRLKPFLDAYQGPYSDKFRYWTGLLLLLRIFLFISDTGNFVNDYSISFFCTILTATTVVFILLKKAVYRHRLANWIELLSMLNLATLCLVSWLASATHYEQWHPIREYATCTSVAMVMLMLLGISLYQCTLTCCPNAFTRCRRNKLVEQTIAQADRKLNASVTSSVVELQECDQLKEPLLDSD